jgi:hypothetical protein
METALSNLQPKNEYVADSIPALQASDVGNILTGTCNSWSSGRTREISRRIHRGELEQFQLISRA